MINNLDKLTVNQFIELVNGETSVLCTKGDHISAEALQLTRKDIIIQYLSIAYPDSINSLICETETLVKASISVALFNTCKNLISLGYMEETKEILNALGEQTSDKSDSWIEAKVSYLLEKEKRSLSELQAVESDIPNDAVRQFDEQTATLMAHFKFQINTMSMKASLYAHLVARYNREIKARNNALKYN